MPTVALLALGVIGIFSPSLVSAHATQIHPEPEPNSVLFEPHDRVINWFPEPKRVPNDGKEQADLGESSLDTSDPGVMSVTLRPLLNGNYTVAERNLPTVDDQTVRSSFIFSVGESPGAAAITDAPEQPVLRSPLEPVLRWLVLVSGLASVGGVGFQLLVSRPVFASGRSNRDRHQLGAKLESRTSKLIWVSVGVFLLASLGQLLLQAALVHDIPLYQAVGSPWVSILSDTSWGHFWVWRIGLILAMAFVLGGATLVFPWRGFGGRENNAVSRLAWLLTLIIGAGMLFTLSLTSHGAATVQVRTGALFSDYLHLLAATFWVGGLFHLAAGIPLVLQMIAPDQRRGVLSALGPRFSAVAIITLGTLVVTGLYSAWAQITVLEGVTTPYGWTPEG